MILIHDDAQCGAQSNQSQEYDVKRLIYRFGKWQKALSQTQDRRKKNVHACVLQGDGFHGLHIFCLAYGQAQVHDHRWVQINRKPGQNMAKDFNISVQSIVRSSFCCEIASPSRVGPKERFVKGGVGDLVKASDHPTPPHLKSAFGLNVHWLPNT